MERLFLVVLAATIFAAGTFTGCGDSDNDSPPAPPMEDPIMDEEPTCPNPIVSEPQIFGTNGNLSKPMGEDGNYVTLFDPIFVGEFDSCEVVLKNGETRNLECVKTQFNKPNPFSCFSNAVAGRGLRQTRRASFGCNRLQELRIVCRDRCQEVVFQAPEGQLGRVCRRFG